MYLEDGSRTAMFQAFIPTDADLAAGIALGMVELDGGQWPQAIFASYGCETAAVEVHSGTLSLQDDGSSSLVELTAVVDGETLVRSWTVAAW